ncbi:lysosomal alpha-glucosidase-like [Microplitis mediator]|uniref:lysosomal alpha-glucosidase-like n=1 Tax=Microplitis mediator TaxID=375433 RepID=UPI002552AAC6|nr:lysosomal alpha-glucosidase-like [Microplitis mediator]
MKPLIPKAVNNSKEKEKHLNYLRNKLNQLINVNYNLAIYNVLALLFGMLLLLILGWVVIINQRTILNEEIHSENSVSIFETFKLPMINMDTLKIYDFNEPMATSAECSNIARELRFDCHPENGASELACYDRGCCWEAINKDIDVISERVPLNIPYCFYPPNWKLYKYTTDKLNASAGNFTADLVKTGDSFYKNDLEKIRMQSIEIDENILQVKIFDPDHKRHEPHWPVRNFVPEPKIDKKSYQFEIDNSKPGFRVKRQKNNALIFDSLKAGGFIFADQMLQISTLLPTHNIYGLGEHRTHLKLNTTWQILTMFNRDQPPTENSNLYGSHPFYMIMEEEIGVCHGVLFLNSNAMDVILQPTPALTFRTIGGIFDIYFFMGPTPSDVLTQYSKVVGRPFMPPYWSLGFHLCRFGYGSLEKTKEVWNRTRAAKIPFDTQWNDLDYMDNNNDFTYDQDRFKDLPGFVEEIHAAGMHYIPLIDPGISGSETKGSYPPYDEGLRYDIFIKDPETNAPFIGKVWNRISTVWPDFTHPNISDYWYFMMNSMHEKFQYDGAWIDMNEPSNFYNGRINGCPINNSLNYPPYLPNVVGNSLASKTICMDAKHYMGSHYDVHNYYGTAEAVATHASLIKIRNKRPFVVSRASWEGHGSYAAHWTGDIYSSWYDLKMSVPEVLMYSLFQIPMVGADICGFDGNTTEALCNRWMQLGAFYPFSRNHNSDDTIEQDPVAMGDMVVKSSREALMIRYRFLPYLYTLFARAHMYGETVARPLFIEFPTDRNTWAVDTQFLWGPSFLIVPVLDEAKEEVDPYLPKGIWYDFYSKSMITSKGQNFTFHAPVNTIPIFIRGGSILPAQVPGKTTTESRKNNFELLIALDENGQAAGELFWDDGDSIDTIEKGEYVFLKYNLKNRTLVSAASKNKLKEEMTLGKIQIMGVNKNVNKVMINNKQVKYTYDKKRSYLTIKPINVNLQESWSLVWN